MHRNGWFAIRANAKTIYIQTLNTKENLIKQQFQVTKPNELPVFLAAECGLRAEEIDALHRSNIYPDHIDIKEAIVINEDLEEVVKKPKSVSGYRSISIAKEAYDYIMSLADDGERVCNRSNNNISNNWGAYKRNHPKEISEFPRISPSLCQ